MLNTHKKNLFLTKRRGAASIEFLMVLPLFIILLVTILFVIRTGINKLEAASANRNLTWLQRFGAKGKIAESNAYHVDKVLLNSDQSNSSNYFLNLKLHNGNNETLLKNAYSVSSLKSLSASKFNAENETDTIHDDEQNFKTIINDKQAVYDDSWNYWIDGRSLHYLLLASFTDCDRINALIEIYEDIAKRLPWEIAKSIGRLTSDLALTSFATIGDLSVLASIGLVAVDTSKIAIGYSLTLFFVQLIKTTHDLIKNPMDQDELQANLMNQYNTESDIIETIDGKKLPMANPINFMSLAADLINFVKNPDRVKNIQDSWELLSWEWNFLNCYIDEYRDALDKLDDLKNNYPCNQ